MNLAEQIGIECLGRIKRQPWFPYKSGILRDHATFGFMYKDGVYLIKFSTQIAPYIESLEEGTGPHDIPHAFGRDFNKDGSPFGIGGKFDGKFHPGSTKHKGFISEKSVNAIVEYIKTRYNGKVEVL